MEEDIIRGPHLLRDTMIDITVKKREQNQLERGFTCED